MGDLRAKETEKNEAYTFPYAIGDGLHLLKARYNENDWIEK